MDGAELAYRALLGRIYSEVLISDLKDFTIVFDDTPSCVAMASVVAAMSAARGASTSVVASNELEGEVDNALLLMSPYVENLGERALRVLSKVRRLAALHTPVFYAIEEIEGAARALAGKEVRFGVREAPGEITFYKVRVDGEKLVADVYAVRKLSPDEQAIVRRYEASHS
ncbi:MAG: hypothetical protein QXP98_03825 [Thermoproteus sp.]